MEITRRQLIEAIELNGYQQILLKLIHTSGKEFEEPDQTIIGACALGQALLNLGANPYADVALALGDDFWEIARLNDTERKSPKQIARHLKKIWKDKLDEKVKLREFDYSYFTNYQGIKVR